jgi:hypothetical protein
MEKSTGIETRAQRTGPQIFVFTETHRVVIGHGGSERVTGLATMGPYGTGPFFPAFPTRQLAETYKKVKQLHSLDITPLDSGDWMDCEPDRLVVSK